MPGSNSINHSFNESTPGIFRYRILVYELLNPTKIMYSNVINFHVQNLVITPKIFDIYQCYDNNLRILKPNIVFEFNNPEFIPNPTYSYLWSPSTNLNNNNIMNPTFVYTGSTPLVNQPLPAPNIFNYQLQVTNLELGCTSISTQTVIYHKNRTVLIPNAFTPGGSNPLFRAINAEDYNGAIFAVKDAFQNYVYISYGPTYAWDGYYNGQPALQGVYKWELLLPYCKNNIIWSGQNVTEGTVLLIR